MHRTQIYLPTDMYAWLKTKAKGENTTISDLVRKIVQQARVGASYQMSGTSPLTLLDKEAEPTRELSGLEKIIELSNKNARLGPKDLASNMDEYLYGEV